MDGISVVGRLALAAEHDEMSMYRGGVYVFAKNIMDGERSVTVDYDYFRKHVAGRLDLLPVCRKKLQTVWGALAAPRWQDDPEFLLERHLPYSQLRAPYDHGSLTRHVANVFSWPLDQAHPLWEVHYVDNVELSTLSGECKEAFALVVKTHLAAVDGLGMEEVFMSLVDLAEHSPQLQSNSWSPAKPQARLPYTLKSMASWATAAVDLTRQTARLAAGVWVQRRASDAPLPPMPFSAPQTCLNENEGSQNAKRAYVSLQLPWDSIKALCSAWGGVSAEEVVLCICADALQNYLLDRDGLPDRSLHALVPTVRRYRKGTNFAGCYALTRWCETAPLSMEPLERLRLTHENLLGARRFSEALGYDRFVEVAPYPWLSSAIKMYTRAVRGLGRPLCNFMLSHESGMSNDRIYFAGSELLAQYPVSPALQGVPLSIASVQYRDTLSLGIRFADGVLSAEVPLEAYFSRALEELTIAHAQSFSEQGPSLRSTRSVSGRQSIATHQLETTLDALRQVVGTVDETS